VTEPKCVVLPNERVKTSNGNPVQRDTQITLSPLLSCIESEQASSDLRGLFKSSQTHASVLLHLFTEIYMSNLNLTDCSFLAC